MEPLSFTIALFGCHIQLILTFFLAVSDIKKYKITFEDARVKTRPEQQIKYSGTPYIISGQKIYECEYGVDRNLTTKKKLLDIKAVEMLRKVRNFLF